MMSTDRLKKFRRELALLSWTANTRPDIANTANRAAQVAEKTYGGRKVKEWNEGARMITRTAEIGLRFDTLDLATFHLSVNVDAFFTTNVDLCSKLGYVVLL